MIRSYPRYFRPIHAGILKYVLLGLILFLLVTIRSGDVLAHTKGKPVIANKALGPYYAYVWINPWPAETGTLHVTVSITEMSLRDPDEQMPVLGADVTLSMEHPNGFIESMSIQATHDQAISKLKYAENLNVDHPGEWRMTVAIQGESGEHSLELPVEVTGEVIKVGSKDPWSRLWIWFQRLFGRN